MITSFRTFPSTPDFKNHRNSDNASSEEVRADETMKDSTDKFPIEPVRLPNLMKRITDHPRKFTGLMD